MRKSIFTIWYFRGNEEKWLGGGKAENINI
jgi:hypothetical protein